MGYYIKHSILFTFVLLICYYISLLPISTEVSKNWKRIISWNGWPPQFIPFVRKLGGKHSTEPGISGCRSFRQKHSGPNEIYQVRCWVFQQHMVFNIIKDHWRTTLLLVNVNFLDITIYSILFLTDCTINTPAYLVEKQIRKRRISWIARMVLLLLHLKKKWMGRNISDRVFPTLVVSI